MESTNMKTKRNKGNFYRSGLEAKVAKLLPRGYEYEPFRIEYVTHRKYTPDFVFNDVLIEVKGYFRVGDTQKYKAIRDSIHGTSQLVFLLADENKKVRKGSKMTMGQWCVKEKIQHFDVKTIDKLIEYCEGS